MKIQENYVKKPQISKGQTRKYTLIQFYITLGSPLKSGVQNSMF